MDDTQFGTRNKRGDFRPKRLLEYPPFFAWPARPKALLKWVFGFPGFLWPWNTVFLGIAILVWAFSTPPLAEMRTVSAGWVAFILGRNALLTLAVFGAFHLRLYTQRSQATRFKFNGRWPDEKNPAFLFGNQTRDNLFWTFASGVPIWTAFEVGLFWGAANGHLALIGFSDHPIWFLLLFFLIPVWRDIHFYVVHRLIHWPPLYRRVHSLHHNNVNPGPWSGLAMHPVEHLLYFSTALIFIVVPFHPVHLLYILIHAGLAPAPGHAGFDRLEIGQDRSVDLAVGHGHYLHHKFFECNYADGPIPVDKWFGTFHDGSEESEARMIRRFKDLKARSNA